MLAAPASISRRSAPRAFTLIELMVVLAIAAVLATMVLPMMRNDDRLKLMSLASLVRSDLEYAQALSISQPSNPVCVVFDPDAASYYIAYASDDETPIVREDTGLDYVVVLGQGRAVAADGVTLAIDDADKNTLQYDSHGGLNDFGSTPVITLTSGDDWFTLTIEPTTGSISENSGSS